MSKITNSATNTNLITLFAENKNELMKVYQLFIAE